MGKGGKQGRGPGSLNAAGGGDVVQLDPSLIYFTFSRIRPLFSCGRTLHSTLEQIMNGTLTPQDLPLLCVFTDGAGRYYSQNNRRLYIYKQLQEEGKLRTVPVRLRPLPQTKRMSHKYSPSKCSLTAKVMPQPPPRHNTDGRDVNSEDDEEDEERASREADAAEGGSGHSDKHQKAVTDCSAECAPVSPKTGAAVRARQIFESSVVAERFEPEDVLVDDIDDSDDAVVDEELRTSMCEKKKTPKKKKNGTTTSGIGDVHTLPHALTLSDATFSSGDADTKAHSATTILCAARSNEKGRGGGRFRERASSEPSVSPAFSGSMPKASDEDGRDGGCPSMSRRAGKRCMVVWKGIEEEDKDTTRRAKRNKRHI